MPAATDRVSGQEQRSEPIADPNGRGRQDHAIAMTEHDKRAHVGSKKLIRHVKAETTANGSKGHADRLARD
jgi:hypothetical protein